MNTQSLARYLLGAAFVLASLTVHAYFTGKVVGVSGGDTVTVLDAEPHQYKVRLVSMGWLS